MKPKHLLALGVLAAVAAASLTAAEKPAPAQLTEQQKLKERVDTLESQLKEAQAKADRAAMEKDYIERVQKQYESYYEKAFNTQVAIVSILALFITIVLAVAARFGFQTFDRRIDTALAAASAQLRTEFNQQLRTDLETLRKDNAERVKQLEHELTSRIAKLESDLAKKIAQQQADLMIVSNHNVMFLQGIAAMHGESHSSARDNYRGALLFYKQGKTRGVISRYEGAKTVANVFRSIEGIDPKKFDEEAKKELADHRDLYDALKEELAAAALEFPKLAPNIQPAAPA